MRTDALQILKKNREKLKTNFIKGRVPDLLDRNAQVLDDYFCEGFAASNAGLKIGISKNPYTIIALGGYGRREQCIHSDVDILFLFRKNVPDDAGELLREIVYPLWDIGLETGYSVRSVKECVKLAADDLEAYTALLSARFICGASDLYWELKSILSKKITRPASGRIIKQLIGRARERHERFGDSTYLLEPNLKEGLGGLRDYHSMLWFAGIKSDLGQPRDLEYSGFLSHEEYAALRDALEYIWNVRNRLHYITGRECDQLYFEHQITIAEMLKLKGKNGQRPVERFLSTLHGKMECIKRIHLMQIDMLELSKRGVLNLKINKPTGEEGIEVRGGMLGFKSSEHIAAQPDLLIKIFQKSSSMKIPLNVEAKRLVKEFLYLVGAQFRRSVDIVAVFERILMAPPQKYNVLFEMQSTGFLGKFIPEFRKIESRIQYNQYHLYPVDLHSLRTVQAVKSFKDEEIRFCGNLCSRVYLEVKRRKLLLWAALLHDIGKGDSETNHSLAGALIAKKLLKRVGMPDADMETIVFLIENHLFMAKIALRRDLQDEETAFFCAGVIKTPERLRLLFLLSVADSIATGPKAWSEWTALLMRDLFVKTMEVLKNGELSSRKVLNDIEAKKKRICDRGETPEERTLLLSRLETMSARYLIYNSVDDIFKHIKLFDHLGPSGFVWDIDGENGSGLRTVTICGRDSFGFFSKVAGAFAMNGIDIVDAQGYGWGYNVALDVFKVKPPPDLIFEDQKWEKTRIDLYAALNDNDYFKDLHSLRHEPTFSAKGKPYRIEVDNKTSRFFTIVEVTASDFTGLLFRITDALYRIGLDVRVTKISTKVDQVIDVFYVRSTEGMKISDKEDVRMIKRAIRDVLPCCGTLCVNS